MGRKKRDSEVLIGVKALVALLPLLFKLFLLFLKYKRMLKKREKVFRKTLKKEGLDAEIVDRLCDDLPEIKMRDFLSKYTSGRDSFKPF